MCREALWEGACGKPWAKLADSVSIKLFHYRGRDIWQSQDPEMASHLPIVTQQVSGRVKARTRGPWLPAQCCSQASWSRFGASTPKSHIQDSTGPIWCLPPQGLTSWSRCSSSWRPSLWSGRRTRTSCSGWCLPSSAAPGRWRGHCASCSPKWTVKVPEPDSQASIRRLHAGLALGAGAGGLLKGASAVPRHRREPPCPRPWQWALDWLLPDWGWSAPGVGPSGNCRASH